VFVMIILLQIAIKNGDELEPGSVSEVSFLLEKRTWTLNLVVKQDSDKDCR